MVDAWTPATEAAVAAADGGASPAEVLAAAADAAHAGAEATIPLVATKGRASYLGERSARPPGPGRALDRADPARCRPGGRVSDARRPRPAVALVLVSHSRALAQGAAELAGQMAPGVLLVAAGGMDGRRPRDQLRRGRGGAVDGDAGRPVGGRADGPRLGGAHGRVGAGAARRRTSPRGCGSRTRRSSRVRSRRPSRRTGERTWRRSWRRRCTRARRSARRPTAPAAAAAAAGRRRAAGDARCCATRSACTPGPRRSWPGCSPAYDAKVQVNGANAASVLELMKLGATQGVELQIEAEGPQAARGARRARRGGRGRVRRGLSGRCCEQPHMDMRPVQSCTACKVAPRAELYRRRARPRAA